MGLLGVPVRMASKWYGEDGFEEDDEEETLE